jgi:hypothetical protein
MLTRSYWVKNHLAAGFQSAIRQLCHCAYLSNKNKGSALYLSRIILQLVSRFALVQRVIVIILTSEVNAKKKTAFATSVERAITRTVPNLITFSKDGFAATI